MSVTVDRAICPTCVVEYDNTTVRWVVCDSRGADRGCFDDEVEALNYALEITGWGW
jgi:hypothetical protein